MAPCTAGQQLLTSGVLKENFVIETESQFRHSGQLDFHLDGTHYLTLQDLTSLTHLQGGVMRTVKSVRWGVGGKSEGY